MPRTRTPSLPNDDSIQFTLRLPPDVSEWIRIQAGKDGRSVNSEIIQFLRQAMQSTITGSADITRRPVTPKPGEPPLPKTDATG